MISHPGVTKAQRIELYKITVAHSDIGEALLTTRLFMKTVKDMKDENYLPLQDSIVVAYARPFKRNIRGKSTDIWRAAIRVADVVSHYYSVAVFGVGVRLAFD